MKENQEALIDQTEKIIHDQIKQLEAENSNAAEKVFLRESQIKQTSSDLQDAYNRLIRQSQEECDTQLMKILNEPKKDFIRKSQIDIKKKFDKFRKEINDESNKIKIAEASVEVSEKYISQFDNLIKSLENKIKTNFSTIEEFCSNKMQESVRKLQNDNSDQTQTQYYQKQCLKIKKLEAKNSILSSECDKLATAKKETTCRISRLSNDIIALSQKISISFQSKEYIQLENQTFDIIDVEPAYQKRKMPTGNLLVLAPIHSLTRQMKGAQGASRFFLKKSMF